MASYKDLSEAALRMRNASPEMFENFVSKVDDRVQAVTMAVTQASAADILVCQGRAQEALFLQRILKECHLPKPQQPTPL